MVALFSELRSWIGKILSLEATAWAVAALWGAWGAVMGVGDYSVANLFFLVASALLILKWGHFTRILEPSRRIGIFTIGVVVVLTLAVGELTWAHNRSVDASSTNKRLRELDKLEPMQNQIANLKKDNEDLKRQLGDIAGANRGLISQLDRESGRREQAEKDLGLKVESTARQTVKDTASSVSAGLRSEPLKVQVDQASRAPLDVEAMKLYVTDEKSTHTDAPYALKLTVQATTAIPKFVINFVFSDEVKYAETALRNGGVYYGSTEVAPKDHKFVVVHIESLGEALLDTGSPITVHVASDRPIEVVKFLRLPNPS